MKTSGRGQVVFVAGDEGSGRSALLVRVADVLSRGRNRPRLLAGGFEGGRYVAWDWQAPKARLVARASRVVNAVEPVVALAGGVVPLAGLLTQVLSKSAAALQLAEAGIARGSCSDLGLVPATIRELCDEGPVVCLVDDADQADSEWFADLVLTIGRVIASEMPLLLVLVVRVDTTPDRAEHPASDEESDVAFAARMLIADGLATWHMLPRVTAEEFRNWIGGNDSRLSESS